MARRSLKKTAAEPATVDVIDEMITKLNTLDNIEFVRDAWVNKAPDNYGVAEPQGEVQQLWADGHLVDSIQRVILHAYVTGDDDSIAYDIEGKLEELESEGKADLTHTMNREFDYMVGKVHWQWIISLYGGLIVYGGEATAADTPAESDPSGEG